MILMMQGRFPLQRSASGTMGAKVANNVSNSIEFGRSLGGVPYIYTHMLCGSGLFFLFLSGPSRRDCARILLQNQSQGPSESFEEPVSPS